MLKPTKVQGRVDAVLINSDRDQTLASRRVDKVRATFAGFEGDAHGGLTRSACSRVTLQYKRGSEIRNTRQVSILSAEELALVAQRMEIGHLEPEWVGANLLISGIPELSFLPPSSRLIFSGGASLVVDMENGPCKYPGQVIDEFFPGFGKQFPKAALHHRGVTAWVEYEGLISVDDEVALHVPMQPPYRYLSPAGS